MKKLSAFGFQTGKWKGFDESNPYSVIKICNLKPGTWNLKLLL